MSVKWHEAVDNPNTNHMWDHVKDAPGMMLAKLTGMIDAKLAAKTVWT